MPSFKHKRTGRIVEVSANDAFRFNNARYELVHEAAGQDWEPENVPSGTVAEVLAWVGDSDLRRQSALTVERAGRKRKGILEALA